MAAGARDLGENYVQEAAEKIGALASDAAAAGGLLRWHFIGHLQTNKVARAIPLFDRLHTLDSPRLAREVERVAGQTGRTVRALVQVNVSGESTKRGLPPEGPTEGFRGHDGVMTIVEAIKIAGKAEPKAIREALWKVNITGVNGPIRFVKDGPAGKESGQSAPSIFLVQVKDGKASLPAFVKR